MSPRPRQLLWIEGTAPACQRHALTRLAALPPETIGWVGEGPITHPDPPHGRLPVLSPGRGRSLLGRTLLAGVIDAHAGFDPDDLGALAGALGGGAHCLLLTPPAADWPTHRDAVLAGLLSDGVSPAPTGSVFITRLIRHLTASPAVVRCPAATHAVALPRPSADDRRRADAPEPTAAQQALIDAIIAMARSDDAATLLVTADRGRGKSAALGMAARALGRGAALRLTAPSRSTAATALDWAGEAAPRFLAPEAVRPAPSVLLIDEAAALPLARVARLVEDNPRCVITGTVHGYEGSGRGLVLRLAETLAEQPREFRRMRLSRPVRWSPDDPLEALVDQILLLDTDPSPHGPPAAPRVERLTAAALADSERALAEAFGLLVAGHYQTRPRDLRQLLDDPSMQIWIARDGDAVIGILAARQEGGLDPALSREIHAGRRRPAGHLIAQSLTFHAGIGDAATRRGLRIQRIAIHPDCRRNGIGRALIEAARASARADGLDWLGSSFGMTAEVLDFWLASGFRAVRVGNRRDARSGAHAVIMLQALNPRGENLLTVARERLAVHLPDQLAHGLHGLAPAIVARLQRGLPVAADTARVDREDLEAFARGHRPLLDTHGALARWAARTAAGASMGAGDRRLLDCAITRPQDGAAMARGAGLAGRREAIAHLRHLLANSLRTDDE